MKHEERTKKVFTIPALRVFGTVSGATGTSVSSLGSTNEPVGNDSGTLQGRKKT